MRLTLLVLLVTGCGREQPWIDEAPPLWSDEPVDISVHTLLESGTQLARLQGRRALMHQDAQVWLHDPRAEAPELVMQGQAELRGGAWLADEGVLIATEAGLSFWDGELWESPVTERLDGELLELRDAGEALWIRDEGGWHWSTSEAWSTPRVEGAACTEGLVAVSARQAWLQRGDQLALLVRDAQTWRLEEHWKIPGLRDFAVDASGTVWATDGLDLHRRTDAMQWRVETLPSSVAQVAAHPAADGVWIRTTDAAYVGDSQGLSPVEIPEGWWLGADAFGGLVLRTDQGLVAARRAPGLALLDLPETGLDGVGSLTVTALAEPADTLSSLTLSLDGREHAIGQRAPFRATLELSELSRGSHELVLSASWTDGRTAQLQAGLLSEAGAVTWRDHVQTIFQDRCQVCHGGSADTVLETAQDWQSNVELILEQVETQRMPLGNDPLPNEEIELIRAWRDGGFQ